jgi:hypothetical protein
VNDAMPAPSQALLQFRDLFLAGQGGDLHHEARRRALRLLWLGRLAFQDGHGARGVVLRRGLDDLLGLRMRLDRLFRWLGFLLGRRFALGFRLWFGLHRLGLRLGLRLDRFGLGLRFRWLGLLQHAHRRRIAGRRGGHGRVVGRAGGRWRLDWLDDLFVAVDAGHWRHLLGRHGQRGRLVLVRDVDGDVGGQGLGFGIEQHRQRDDGRQDQRDGADQAAAGALLLGKDRVAAAGAAARLACRARALGTGALGISGIVVLDEVPAVPDSFLLVFIAEREQAHVVQVIR